MSNPLKITIFTENKTKVKPIKPSDMKTYYFNVKQNFGGEIDDQNVWVRAKSKEEAIRAVKSDFHSIVDITLVRVK